MVKLGIDLQDGFDGDEVIVTVNGSELLHQMGVSTKGILGLADSSELEVEDGPLTVEIEIPNRGIAERLNLDGTSIAYLGVSVADDKLRTFVAREPFGYA